MKSHKNKPFIHGWAFFFRLMLALSNRKIETKKNEAGEHIGGSPRICCCKATTSAQQKHPELRHQMVVVRFGGGHFPKSHEQWSSWGVTRFEKNIPSQSSTVLGGIGRHKDS